MIQIDGSSGEGGGQIVRSSLALAIVTGKPFRIDKIRAGREKPGLMRQHLTAARAAAEICGGSLEGDAIGATALAFTPGRVHGGEYRFSIGTAGSTTLVLQTVLLPLMLADRPSRLILEGGTHNPHAPPFAFLEAAYLPLVAKMGPQVRATLERAGFYPAGGGRIVVEIEPVGTLRGIDLLERGPNVHKKARAYLAAIPRHVAERELRVIEKRLGWDADKLEIFDVPSSGPGNLVTIELAYEHVTEVFTGFGVIGQPAEAVAGGAVDECQRYLKGTAPVGEHLTDQLMLPLALAGGSFLSTGLSRHATTHLELIRKFVDVRVSTERRENGEILVRFE